MKILINTPDYKKPHLGGVANHYHGLLKYWKEKVQYNIIGSRKKNGDGKFWLPLDILKFIFKVLFLKPKLIVLNPSLGSNALIRDYIFLKISKLFGKKVIIFFHGFNPNYANRINKQKFINKYNKADAFIVLSQNIRTTLQGWGISKPIFLSTTKVENSLVSKFNIDKRNGTINNILYLARIEREKGIYLAIDVFKQLNKIYPQLHFTIVGNGKEFEAAQLYAKELKDKIIFTGALSGESLQSAFINADLYLFTSYHEGMPTSVLEAMAFGLPIITRPVGGLVDFFQVNKMGEMIDSFDASDFIFPIKKYLECQELSYKTSLYNYNYAHEHFLASQVATQLEKIFNKVINS